jgi:broad specificity phosphatase PhoE
MVVLLCSVGVAQAAGGLDIYFVRHAETQANATGEHNSGNSNMLSEQGEEQVSALGSKLKALHFDAILVSPAERAVNTILPYLKETGQKGEIWPEITECCWQKDRGDIASGKLTTSSMVRLSTEQEAYFTFRDENSKRKYGNESYADGVAQVRRAEELLKKHYFCSGKTILIVAHYHSGQVLLAELLGVTRDELPNLENAKVTHLRQGEDGRFTLLSINDEDIVP